MKVFVAILVALVALVNADPREDQKALIAKLTPIYEKLTEAEIKPKAEANMKTQDDLWKDIIGTYEKTELKPLATFYSALQKYIDQSIVDAFTTLDKLEETSRRRGYTGVGVASEVGIWNLQEYKKTQAKPVTVTDTEDGLRKKLADEEVKLFTMMQTLIAQMKKLKETAFWGDYLTAVEEFVSTQLKTFDEDVKKETSADKRAKLLQIELNDLTDLYEKERP